MLEKRILGHQQNNILQNTTNQQINKNNQSASSLKKIILISMGIVFLLFSVLQFLKIPGFTIRTIHVTGVYTVDPEHVENFAQDYINKTNWTGISMGNVVIFRPKKLAASILDQFASFKNVRVYFSNPYEITISTDEFTPEYLWCAQQCLLVNHEGYLYQYNAQITPGSFIVFKGALAQPDFELRNNIFNSKLEKDFFEMLLNELQEKHIRVVSIDNINSDSVFITIDILNSSVLPQYAQIRVDKKITKDYLDIVLNILNNDKNFKSSILNNDILDYIDLRYPEKIFYKFINRPQVGVAGASITQEKNQ